MISYHCNLCEKPAVLLLSEDGESRLLCADHSPFPFAPIAELATLRVDRDALAARVTALRPVVWRFAELMEARLQENDDKGGWSDMTRDELFRRLSEETRELFECVTYRRPWTEEIGRQAADVANFAMFITDVCGALAAPAPGATPGSGGTQR